MSEYEFPYYTMVKCPSYGNESKIKHSHKIPNGQLGNCRTCGKGFLLADNNTALNVEKSNPDNKIVDGDDFINGFIEKFNLDEEIE